MRTAARTLAVSLAVALLAVPAAFAKGPGGQGGKPAFAGGGHGKPTWAGPGKPAWAGKGNGKAKAESKANKQRGEEDDVTAQGEHDNPAWQCKDLWAEMGDEFVGFFGENWNGANAFGMCVSRAAQGEDVGEAAGEADAETCELDEDAAAEDEVLEEDSGEQSAEEGGESAEEGGESTEGFDEDANATEEDGGSTEGLDEDATSEACAADDPETADDAGAGDEEADDVDEADEGDEADDESDAPADPATVLARFLRL